MNLRVLACLLVFPGGLAAIAWQLIWQHHAALALGVSAQATALILATLMGGMLVGALLGARWLTKRPDVNPWLVYGFLELVAGVWGQIFRWLQGPISRADSAIFNSAEGLAPGFLVVALIIAVGPAALAIGATTPLLGIIAQRAGARISLLYGVNTAGAAIGALAIAFWLIPALGIAGASWLLTFIQISVFLSCVCAARLSQKRTIPKELAPTDSPVKNPWLFAFVTGFVAFLLEVVWFRLIRSAWLSTTDSFAIILFAFLIALAVGAWIAPVLRRRNVALPAALALSGLLIILAIPLIERFDIWRLSPNNQTLKLAGWLAMSLAVMGPPVALLGTSLPWLLDTAREPKAWARLYAWNTIGAVLGSVAAAWILLPMIGPVPLSWLTGLGMVAFAIFYLDPKRRIGSGIAAAAGFGLAWAASSGIGSSRLAGASPLLRNEHSIVEIVHGSDVTTAVVDVRGGRALFIDGYAATGEFGVATSYMDAMGRLPMLLHQDPKDTLVICFGTGQTAHALRSENPNSVTAVDVNRSVFSLASHFSSNRGVLEDERVETITMDGRALLRRSDRKWDVITLEPMPPLFAGTNALYSTEFYELISARLEDGGIAAQWFPMHLLSPESARSVAASFIQVFPSSILWVDPTSFDHVGAPQQGILLGSRGERDWSLWPGFARETKWLRPLDESSCAKAVALNPEQLARYVDGAEPVTDDNLLLTHGSTRRLKIEPENSTAKRTMEQIDRARRSK
ncbi:MAG: spermidine synthase [Verrucomicrobiales bacterium]|jgi:spermidine synthase